MKLLLVAALLLPTQVAPAVVEEEPWDFWCPDKGDKCVVTREALQTLLKDRQRMCYQRG